MSGREPNEPTPAGFKEGAKKSQNANIADGTAAYDKAETLTEGRGAIKGSEARPSNGGLRSAG